MSLPIPNLNLDSIWMFRNASGALYTLPAGTKPPSSTPGLAYSISLARDASPIAPTVLMPLAQNVPTAHYFGSFNLADDGLDLVMSGGVLLGGTLEVEGLIQAIEFALSQAVWFENREDGEFFRVPVSTARAKRGKLERKPSSPNRLEFDLRIFLENRDWVHLATGQHYGTIF
jgi:hypothetical protein